MKKMFLLNLMEGSLYERLFCRILREKYEYNCIKTQDSQNENYFKNLSDNDFKDFISQYDLIVINNGYRPLQTRLVKLIRELNKKTFFTEIGHLPQRGNVHIDYKGMYHESSICENLDWVNDEEMLKTEFFLKKSIYSKFTNNQKQSYILVVLQMDWDASLTKSGFNNEFLINYCLSKYYDKKIIFKFHPRHTEKDKNIIHEKFKNQKLIFDDKTPFLFLCKNSEKVVGMSSTALIEALALNKAVEAISECPIFFHNMENKIEQMKILTAYRLHQYHHNDLKDSKRCLDFIIKRSKYLI